MQQLINFNQEMTWD